MAKLKSNQDPLYYILQHSLALVGNWAERIDELQKTGSLKDLCVAWDTLWSEYEQIDKKRKELLALFDKLNEEIIPKAFEDAGVDKIAVPELARSFYPLPQYSASFVKGKETEAIQWLKNNLLGALVKETVHRGTLAATLHDRIVNENKEPPDCMKFNSYKITGSSKYTPKGN